MRLPADVQGHHAAHRRGLWLLSGLAALVILVVVLQGLAGFYTNFLWYHWSGLGEVWGVVTWTKIVLATVFVALAFALLSTSFWLVDKIAPRAMFMAPDTELVRRYQAVVGPHARAARNLAALLVALALGTGASDQWRNWLLFEHAVPFGRRDPLFGRDASFFVFRLPFLSWLVDWVLVALLVTLVLTAVDHLLNGAIRIQNSPRIEPRALAHLSLLLGLMALVKAWAYYYVARFSLDLSTRGVVRGAGYTDVHVRLPALTLLSVVSLVAFVLLVVNVYQRTWVLPAVAFGLWAFIALVIGIIYPGLVQAFRVTPSQSKLEQPYIERNIAATRYAMGISGVREYELPANQDLTPSVLRSYAQTLGDVVLWDPAFVAPTFEKLQDVHSYYQLSGLVVDRYRIDGRLEPVVAGVRELDVAALPDQSWVNTHLVYTHGYGLVAAQGNVAKVDGTPRFVAGNLPPTSASRSLHLSEPGVYYAPGQNQYVIVQTGEPEIDYQASSGNQTSEGRGTGGIPLDSFLVRAAFAAHLRDFNLLVSNLVTSRSRILPITNVRRAMQKALPFLRIDSHPYPVVDNGRLYWIADAYVTSGSYPYGQYAQTGMLPSGSGLSGSYDFVRDAVKIVMDAHSGRMRFYAVDASTDPVLEAYEQAFPGLFRPLSQMDRVLRQHLRYPQDLLEVQAAMYGRYHVSPSEAALFYSGSATWDLSEISTSENGEPLRPLKRGPGGGVASFQPIYEMLRLPGHSHQSFDAVEPLVPYSASGSIQTLKALLVADSSPSHYGQLESFYTPPSVSIPGPEQANSLMQSNADVSKQITLLGQVGSVVSLGTVQILPIADSLLYVRPVYVSSAQTELPQLRYVVVLYGQQVAMAPTLDEALAKVFGGTSGGTGGPGGQSPGSSGGRSEGAHVPAAVRKLLSEATSAFDAGRKALAAGDLGAYQQEVVKAERYVAAAEKLLTQHGSTAASSRSARFGTSPPTVPAISSYGATGVVTGTEGHAGRSLTGEHARRSAASPTATRPAARQRARSPTRPLPPAPSPVQAARA